MISSIVLRSVNHFVLKKQHLTDDSKIDDVIQIAKDIGGLHGTSATGPYLSLFARSNTFRRENLAVEMSKKKNMARIRYVRNTIHILPKNFIPVAYAGTTKMAEVTAAQFSKNMGITPTQYGRISNKILKILKGRGLTTREIKKKLRTATNITSIVNLMCDKGLLVRSLPREGWKSTQHVYFLFEDYYPDLDLTLYDEKEARGEIVKRYILSFGPVSEQDIAWWTGFPKLQVKEILEGLGDEVSSIEISELEREYLIHSAEREALQSLEVPEHPVVSVLPGLDPYVMGYKDRERYLHPKHHKMVFDRSGNATSTILINGRVVGIWDLEEALVKIFYLTAVEKDARTKIRSKVSDVGKFIAERPVQIKVCDSMVPLPKRTAGSFMSPLKDG
ncbi:MAG: AlkZ family DNA glycosylase [Candidatus Aminicenantes bacterium]|nr:MAG: AlkZ family DNA glycosylase [Candidatus Aminicenantes bacterium]